MKYILIAAFAFLTSTSYSQFIQDIEGKPYFQKTATETKGSPFLFNDWVSAKVVISDGRIYDDLMINIDLIQQVPLFIKDGKTFTFTDDITEFSLVGSKAKMTFKKGSLINKALPDIFFEIINNDPLVIKNTSKTLVEESAGYGSANKQYSYSEANTYYVSLDGKLKKITPRQKDQYVARQ